MSRIPGDSSSEFRGERSPKHRMNMAECELRGELRYRDGETRRFTAKTENNLKSIIGSVKKLNSEISEVLTSLVEQERAGATGSRKDGGDTNVDDDEEQSDSDEQDDATEPAAVKPNSEGPPAKRMKAFKP
ncbi:EKC/KEOPS complex subunit GON7 [Hoplias malabaricus]|uniref:EKC/KEOPS complex subunit GON7 n=1 Tax=Hoplias malabaricus TaxID=27720 RepID=UPI00346203C0